MHNFIVVATVAGVCQLVAIDGQHEWCLVEGTRMSALLGVMGLWQPSCGGHVNPDDLHHADMNQQRLHMKP